MLRQAAKAVKKEKMTITEDTTGKWTLKSESTFKNTLYEFTPDVEFNETRADGAEVKVRMKASLSKIINFQLYGIYSII